MPTDPLFGRPDWKAARAYWRGCGAPCARCGGDIDRRPGHRGEWSLDVGHIVSRWDARRMGWTDAQINALSNTQPEHQRCNRAAGARMTQAIRRGKADTGNTRRLPRTSQQW